MKVIILLGLALALAVDALAVTVGLSCSRSGLKSGQSFRLASAFGFFQFLMPVIGWLIGENLLKLVARYDHWVAFGLLLLIGGRMAIESFRPGDKKYNGKDLTRGWPLLTLAIATSLDALATGLSLPVLGLNIWLASLVIGLTAFIVTIIGSRLGPALGQILGRRAELAGGLVLIMIGLKILVDHLGQA